MLRLCSVCVCLLSVHCLSLTPWTQEKLTHRALTLTEEEVRGVLSLSDVEVMWQRDLRPLLVVRYPGSTGNQAVQDHIKSTLGSLAAGWEVTEDRFVSPTPYGPLTFTNLAATLRPAARRRLVLACHFDSKYYPSLWHGLQFLGATDSAVPCAMMLEAARSLDRHLKSHKESSPDLSLQLIFFDGEEAFRQWSATDSLYGSRHLAQKMAATPHPAGATETNQLDAMDLFVLLDLLGAPSPRFGNQFPDTAAWLSRFQTIEQRLHSMNLLMDHPLSVEYFWPDRRVAHVLDDHVPFLNRGVRILHLIPYPFPSVWHSFDDNEQNLDRNTIHNLNKILQVFILEYLNIRPSVPVETQNHL